MSACAGSSTAGSSSCSRLIAAFLLRESRSSATRSAESSGADHKHTYEHARRVFAAATTTFGVALHAYDLFGDYYLAFTVYLALGDRLYFGWSLAFALLTALGFWYMKPPMQLKDGLSDALYAPYNLAVQRQWGLVMQRLCVWRRAIAAVRRPPR